MLGLGEAGSPLLGRIQVLQDVSVSCSVAKANTDEYGRTRKGPPVARVIGTIIQMVDSVELCKEHWPWSREN